MGRKCKRRHAPFLAHGSRRVTCGHAPHHEAEREARTTAGSCIGGLRRPSARPLRLRPSRRYPSAGLTSAVQSRASKGETPALKLGILLGDDIGHEVVPECVKVIKAAAARTGLPIDWRPLPIGKRGHEEHGDTLPAITEQALRDLDGWIMGPIGHAAYPRNDPTWVMP